MKERDTLIDIESGVDTSKEVVNPALSPDDRIGIIVPCSSCSTMPMSAEKNSKGDNSANLLGNPKNAGDSPKESGGSSKKERCKSVSAKKPPRPPRGLSLDAADQKLIKEISELAMIKRVRIERMKALQKMKAKKASSLASASSIGNLVAVLSTVLFCIIIIFQGCHSSGLHARYGSPIPYPGLGSLNEVIGGNIPGLQNQQKLSSAGLEFTSLEPTKYNLETAP